MKRRVRWRWIALAVIVLVAGFLLSSDLSGSCMDYVNAPGVCTRANEDPRTWVLLVIGPLILVGALYQAFRRR